MASGVLASAVLRDGMNGKEFLAKTMWDLQPIVVLVLRRPGCVLCRDEALSLWKVKPDLDRLGVGLACVVHEWREAEISAFRAGFWPGPLFLDVDKSFYKAINDGMNVRRGSLLELMNPFGAAWRRIKDANSRVKEHNIVGDGLTMGGACIVKGGPDGSSELVWSHLEKGIGDIADPKTILEQAAKLARQGAKQ